MRKAVSRIAFGVFVITCFLFDLAIGLGVILIAWGVQ